MEKEKPGGGNAPVSELQTRDYLALDRTILANERTFLAYIRTFVALAGGGVGLIELFEIRPIFFFGAICIACGFLSLILGFRRYFITKRKMRSVYRTGRWEDDGA